MGIFQEVSNWVLGSYKVRTTQATDGAQYQHVRIDVGDGTAESQVTAANPLPVTVVSGGGGGSDVNLIEVGGVAVALGQAAEAASIPVVLATEQDTAKDGGATAGNFTGAGVWDGINEAWYPTPADQTGTPYSTIAEDDSSNKVSLLAKLTAPTSGERGLVTRNIPSGTHEVAPAAVTTSGTITTSTSTVVLSGITSYGGVCISIRGTYAGVNFTPEVSSDGTTYTTVSMSRQDTPQLQQSSGALTNTTRMWIAPTLGCSYFRVRATARTSGTATIDLFASLAAVPTAVQTLPSGTQTISGTVTANPVLTTSGGGLPYKNIDLNATGVSVKASKTYVSDIYVYNDTAATIYVKVYNKATAPSSADTPVQVYGVPTKAGECILGVQGIQLATGFGIRCTTGVADADNTSPAANGCVFSCTYT